MFFQHNSYHKNLFLSAYHCWEARLTLGEMDQIFEFRGTVGNGDSYLEFKLLQKL